MLVCECSEIYKTMGSSFHFISFIYSGCEANCTSQEPNGEKDNEGSLSFRCDRIIVDNYSLSQVGLKEVRCHYWVLLKAL